MHEHSEFDEQRFRSDQQTPTRLSIGNKRQAG